MMYYYFAYGSNMNKQQMNFRCPTATSIGAATLRDYKLTERQYADIDKSPGSAVCGGIWQITERDLEALDCYEGYPRLYTRYLVDVALENGDIIEAIVYEMTAEVKADRDGYQYSDHYRQVCRTGANDFQISSEY